MPFVKRFVEPRRVSGKQLEVKVWDELEAVQVNTLANLIRQLGSVISYAEEIMGEISETCTSFNVRVSSLRCRTKRLREEVLTELDAIEEVSNMEDLQILFPDGHFESEQIIEEQQMVLLPLPKMTLDYYHNHVTPPPNLHQFTMLREDGENAMHFFSNPNYFFEHWRMLMQRKAEEEAKAEEDARMVEISVQEEKNTSSSTLVREGSFRGSHLSVRRAEVLQMLSEGDNKSGQLFALTRRRTVQPIRSNNERGSQSSLHTTSTKIHRTDLPKWGSSEGLQQRSYSMPWLRTSSVRQGPPSKLQKATREGTPRKDSTREGTPRKDSTREGTPLKDITPDRASSSNSPLTPLSTATPTLTTSRSSLGSESQTKATSTTPVPVVPPVKPKPQREVKKPSPAREVMGKTRTISPLVNGGVEAYDEFDDSYSHTFQRSSSMRAEKSSSAFSRSAKIRRSFSKKNSMKNGISRIYFGDSQIARAAMELAEEKPDDQAKREATPKEDSRSPPPSQGKAAYAGPKKRRFASFKGKQQHHEDNDGMVGTEFHRSMTLPSRPKGSFSKNSMFHAAPTRTLNHGEASSASLDEAARGKSPHSPPRGYYSSSQLEHTSHSKFSNYARIEPLHVHNSTWESDGYGDSTHSTFGTLGRKPQRRKSSTGTTKMATPRICAASSPMRRTSSSKSSPRITNGHVPNGHSDGVFDLTDPEHTITESEEKHSRLDNENAEKKRQSELLDQIRVGIEIKKERQKEELARKSSSNLPWNVSAILERRLVLRPSIDDDEIPDDWSEDL